MNVASKPATNLDFYQERVELACAFRFTARLNMHEAAANHFSHAVSDDGSRFLINPCSMHFSRISASDLLLLDAHDSSSTTQDNAPDPTAWAIHSAVHRNHPEARTILHLHSKYATILASLKDKALPPIDQNTMRFFNRVAIDSNFNGMGLDDEAERISSCLGRARILIMGNHGVMVIGQSIAQAFDHLYYFERACETYICALMTGRELDIVSDEIAEKTAQQWENYPDFAQKHFSELCLILDKEEPDYRY